MSKLERNTSIDIARAIAIISVVIGHASCPAHLKYLVYYFHLPLFYFISGYLLDVRKINNPWAYVHGKLRRLYIPYVKYSVIMLVLSPLLYMVGFISDTFSCKEVFLQLLYYVSFTHSGPLLPLWFLRSLFVSTMILFFLFYFTRTINNSKQKIIIAVSVFVLYVLGALLSVSDCSIPAKLHRDILVVLFLYSGLLYKERIETIIKQHHRISGFVSLLCLVVLIFRACNEQEGGVDIVKPQIGDPVNFIFVTLIGVFAMMQISYYIDRLKTNHKKYLALFHKLIVLIGKESLVIYALHFFAFKFVNLAIVSLYGLDDSAVANEVSINIGEGWWIVYTIIGCVLPLLISRLIWYVSTRLKFKYE